MSRHCASKVNFVVQKPLNYLRQANEVNGGDNAFVRCVSVCVSVCVRAAAGHGS